MAFERFERVGIGYPKTYTPSPITRRLFVREHHRHAHRGTAARCIACTTRRQQWLCFSTHNPRDNGEPQSVACVAGASQARRRRVAGGSLRQVGAVAPQSAFTPTRWTVHSWSRLQTITLVLCVCCCVLGQISTRDIAHRRRDAMRVLVEAKACLYGNAGAPGPPSTTQLDTVQRPACKYYCLD